MGDVADSAIVFWDGRSKGSKLMIDIMHELKKPVVAISYDEIGRASCRERV